MCQDQNIKSFGKSEKLFNEKLIASFFFTKFNNEFCMNETLLYELYMNPMRWHYHQLELANSTMWSSHPMAVDCGCEREYSLFASQLASATYLTDKNVQLYQ